jgi:hypothetical protein
MKVLLPLFLAFTLCAGCASVSARKVMPLGEFKRIYVESRLNDNHRLDELLAAELRRLGREASFGPRTMMPENTDAVLTYDSRWAWDFRSYLIEFNVELHTVRGNKKLAEGRYYQPSITTKSAAEVVREVLPRMFQ